MKKKILLFTVALTALILCFTLPAAAAKIGAPQTMDGLQVAYITQGGECARLAD